MASAAQVVRLARQKRCRCDTSGPLTCAECDGILRVVSPRTKRQELLRDAVVEASRAYMAAFLAEEESRFNESVHSVTAKLQDLRHALAAERKARRA